MWRHHRFREKLSTTESYCASLSLRWISLKWKTLSVSEILSEEKVEYSRGMSGSSSEAMWVALLKIFLSQLNFSLGLFIFTFDIIGSILVLAQHPLRSNPCVTIFLASSTTGLSTILSAPPSILQRRSTRSVNCVASFSSPLNSPPSGWRCWGRR